MLLLNEIAHRQFNYRAGLGNLFRRSAVTVQIRFGAEALVQAKLGEIIQAGEADGDD